MFKKFENWLRAIIAEEVRKVDVSLTDERALISAHAKAILITIEAEVSRTLEGTKVEFDTLEARIKKTAEDEYANFVAKLRQPLQDIIKDPPSQWCADAETVGADHALRKVK
jgi:hypothetical protein